MLTKVKCEEKNLTRDMREGGRKREREKERKRERVNVCVKGREREAYTSKVMSVFVC
jgi:hypothetical protein